MSLNNQEEFFNRYGSWFVKIERPGDGHTFLRLDVLYMMFKERMAEEVEQASDVSLEEHF